VEEELIDWASGIGITVYQEAELINVYNASAHFYGPWRRVKNRTHTDLRGEPTPKDDASN
jgi:hypothetical protein